MAHLLNIKYNVLFVVSRKYPPGSPRCVECGVESAHLYSFLCEMLLVARALPDCRTPKGCYQSRAGCDEVIQSHTGCHSDDQYLKFKPEP